MTEHRHRWSVVDFFLADDRPMLLRRCECGLERAIPAWQRFWEPISFISDSVTHVEALRQLAVGDLVPDGWFPRASTRGIEATALVLPANDAISEYVDRLRAAADAFAAWDGRVLVATPSNDGTHRVLVVDRYGQVYRAYDAADAGGLPSSSELEEWFRFLATACPECGVLDDPIGRGWVP